MDGIVSGELDQWIPGRRASPAQRPTAMSPRISRGVRAFAIYAGMLLALQGVTFLLHQHVAATSTDSYLCKRP